MNEASEICLMRLGKVALLSFLAGCNANTPPTTTGEQQSVGVVVDSPAPRSPWSLDQNKDAMTDLVFVIANAVSDSGMFWVACEQSEGAVSVVYSAGVGDGSRLGRWTHQTNRITLVRFDSEEPVNNLNWWYGDESAYLDDQSQVQPFIQKVRAAETVTFRLMRNDFSTADVSIQTADPDNVLAAWEARCAELSQATSNTIKSQEASEL